MDATVAAIIVADFIALLAVAIGSVRYQHRPSRRWLTVAGLGYVGVAATFVALFTR
jgi:hypothetical protein